MVVRTAPSLEYSAQRAVERRGAVTYLPRFREWRTRQILPLFPSYIFVKNTDGQWHWLKDTSNVACPILIGDKPGLMSDEVIDEFRSREKDGVVHLDEMIMRRGQRVKMAGGGMVGCYGIFVGTRRRDRCAILFALLGGERVVTVPRSYVRAVSEKSNNSEVPIQA